MPCQQALSTNAVPKKMYRKSFLPNSLAKDEVPLQMCSHGVALVESLTTAGTFAHTVRNPVVHTFIAEHVSTCLQDCVLEVDSADGANDKVLSDLLA